MTATAIETETVTLRQRLEEGRMSFPEALRYSTMLAEELRQIHDSGRTCGVLLPSNINLTGRGLEIIPASEAGTVTPYTAPEILQGRVPDTRSDIFGFGAIVYEMVTGRRAFTGDNADALAVALTISVPPPTGLAAVDHLVNHCIAKDPAVRCSRMQKVTLELKLLSFAEAPTRPVATATLRAETQQLEARMAELIENQGRAIDHMRSASDSALGELRAQVSNLRSELTTAQERSVRTEQEHGEQVAGLRAILAETQERAVRAGQEYGEQAAHLKSELGAAIERFSQAEQEHAGQISNLRSELAAAQERLARAEQEHAEQVSQLKSELAAAQERLARTEQEHSEQLSNLRSELAAAQERSARAEQEQAQQQVRVLEGVEQMERNLQAVDERVASGENNFEVLSQRTTMLQEYQAGRLQEFEQTLRSQNNQLALVTAGQAQTDDLVEGVVAAMEVLQSSVFDFVDR